MLLQKIKELAQSHEDRFIAIRHHIHSHPELSFQEYETAAFVEEQLKSFNIPNQRIGKTGVVGILKGKNPDKKVIALRADMDALPITEANEVPYKSQHQGVMHACGHDVHTTCLLGAAFILKQLQDEWEGTVKLIFQPGEEKNPGGASILIKEGVLEDPAPQGIIALHVHPGLQTGKFSFRKGVAMASADEIYMTIKSRGGHAAAPQFTADPILIAANLIVSLQQIVSRNRDPFTPSVLSICSIQGGNATNVIPSEVKLMGTFRAMDESWRFKAHELIRKQTIGLVEAMGAEVEIVIDVGYPVVKNDASLTEKATQLATEFAGAENISETEMRMGAEDFGFYAQEIPACFFRLGVRDEANNIVHGVHTPNFNINENAIVLGVGMMAWLGAKAEI